MRIIDGITVAVLALALQACGGGDAKSEKGEPFSRGIDDPGSGGPTFSADWGPAAVYPPPPYGTSLGSVAPNYELFGWDDPVAAGFDRQALRKIGFADFYDPDGSKGTKVVLVSMSALWCGPCRAEYGGGYLQAPDGTSVKVEPFRKHLAERYDQGFRIFGTVSQDIEAGPADLADLASWGQEFSVEFPLAVDPAEKVGALRDADGVWPAGFVITTRDMRIQAKVSGLDVWDAVDRLLAE